MFLDKLKRIKKEEAASYPLAKLQGRKILYVTVRDGSGSGETVLGKDGSINITENEIIIMCKNNIVFRHEISGLIISDLMNLNGITIRHTDSITKKQKLIIAYFKYHRK